MRFKALFIILASLLFGSQSFALSLSCQYAVTSLTESDLPTLESYLDAEIGSHDLKMQTAVGEVQISVDTSPDLIESSNLLGYIEVRDKAGIMIYAALRNSEEPAYFSARNQRYQVQLICSSGN